MRYLMLLSLISCENKTSFPFEVGSCINYQGKVYKIERTVGGLPELAIMFTNGFTTFASNTKPTGCK